MGKQRWAIEPGQRFGRGTVIEEIRMPGHGAHKTFRGLRLMCDCGTEYRIRLQDAVPTARRPTRSCGCLVRETASALMKRPENLARIAAYARSPEGRAASAGVMRKHGLRSHPLYSLWCNIKTRCYNQNYPQFRDWGGRGITLCERWHDPATFIGDIEQLLGPRPAGMSLDRIDNDGNYEPGNVRWATSEEQRANRRPRKK